MSICLVLQKTKTNYNVYMFLKKASMITHVASFTKKKYI